MVSSDSVVGFVLRVLDHFVVPVAVPGVENTRKAESDAALERKKAADSIKREIVEVSSALTEKLLEREVNTTDHKQLIDSFIEGIGDDDDAN